jgi:hypothetical protein
VAESERDALIRDAAPARWRLEAGVEGVPLTATRRSRVRSLVMRRCDGRSGGCRAPFVGLDRIREPAASLATPNIA